MKFHDILLVVNKKVMLVNKNIVLVKEKYWSDIVFKSRVEGKFDLVSKTFCTV